MAKKFGYAIYASGYGSKTYHFSTEAEAKSEMKKDAEMTAAEYDGELQPYDEDEIVVMSKDGDEIVRFELLT